MPKPLKEILQLPNGAKFVRADLHVHLRHSYDVTDALMKPSAIVDAAESLGLGFLSITDHHVMSGSCEALEYAAARSANVCVIPGVEVSTPQGHLLVYFGSLQALERFLGRLNIISDGQGSRSTNSIVDVLEFASSFNGVGVAAHIDGDGGFETNHPGFAPWKLDLLSHSALVGLEYIDPERRHWFSDSDLEGNADASARQSLYRARVVAQARSQGALGRFNNSDSHRLVVFKSGKATTRIKATNLTFDAFLCAVADPDARIRMDAALPQSFPKVIGLEASGGFLDGVSVHCSQNLNVFFGGRGSGKTSALRAIAFALGRHNSVSAPFDSVRVFCEGADGSRYRFDRALGGETIGTLQAQGEKELSSASTSSFPIEYIAQGELADVAKASLSSPEALQNFLDGHLDLEDLFADEAAARASADALATQLTPLITLFESLPALLAELNEVQAKLKEREDGKLKEIAAFQNRINAERSYLNALMQTVQQYRLGVSFRNLTRDTDQLRKTARLEEPSGRAVADAFSSVEASVSEANSYLAKMAREMGTQLKTFATQIEDGLGKVPLAHEGLQVRIDSALDRLRQDNLAVAIQEFSALSSRKSGIVSRIDRIEIQRSQYEELVAKLTQCYSELKKIRHQIIKKRKTQITSINTVLKRTFDQYVIQLMPDDRGITTEYEAFLDLEMNGSRYTREQMKKLAQDVSPDELADLVEQKDSVGLVSRGQTNEWAAELIKRLGIPGKVFSLRQVWRPYMPVFKVLLKGENATAVDFNTLSDGQKSTILLTVALMSESRTPLIMDQPEDDLDNQFVSQTVVTTLRAVKETRQVIIVTHNANIAVLGDSELLIGMEQVNGHGRIVTAGSIDDAATREAVQACLEGGEVAFRRRALVYGWETNASA